MGKGWTKAIDYNRTERREKVGQRQKITIGQREGEKDRQRQKITIGQREGKRLDKGNRLQKD